MPKNEQWSWFISEQFEAWLLDVDVVVNEFDIISVVKSLGVRVDVEADEVGGKVVEVTFWQLWQDLAQYKLNGFPWTAAFSHLQ